MLLRKRKKRARLIKILHPKPRSGFTLIETIVSVSIFVVVTVLFADLYLIYSKTQRGSDIRQKIVSATGLEMEIFAQDVRLNEIQYQGTIDYNNSGPDETLYSMNGTAGIQTKKVELGLIDASGNTINYFFYDGSGTAPSCAAGLGIYKYINGTACNKLFTLSGLVVLDAGFFINPASNPYPDSNSDCLSGTLSREHCTCPTGANSACYSGSCDTDSKLCNYVEQHPKVTFYIQVEDLFNNKEFILQTTSSGRIYKR